MVTNDLFLSLSTSHLVSKHNPNFTLRHESASCGIFHLHPIPGLHFPWRQPSLSDAVLIYREATHTVTNNSSASLFFGPWALRRSFPLYLHYNPIILPTEHKSRCEIGAPTLE